MHLEELIQEWVDKAEQDIQSARFLLNMLPTPLEIIGFHSQQCVEKILKAIIIKKGSEPPKTHDLLHLLYLCNLNYPDFPNLEETCIRLNNYAVELRYPGPYDIDKNIIIADLKLAETLFLYIKGLLLIGKADSECETSDPESSKA